MKNETRILISVFFGLVGFGQAVGYMMLNVNWFLATGLGITNTCLVYIGVHLVDGHVQKNKREDN